MMTDGLTTNHILSLARAGASSRAWDAFLSAGLERETIDPKALTLKARLLKDRARNAHGETAAQLYLESAQAYTDAAKIHPDSYPLINAAAMSLFAGQHDHMLMLARQVLDLMQSGAGVGETPYWHDATRAEALLLLGELEAAKAALATAVAHAPDAWEDRATTIRQFREIATTLNLPCDWLVGFAPPPALVFSGIMSIDRDDSSTRRDVETAVRASGAGFAYGALAAGADILAAEALLATGAELHVVLPAIEPVFRSVSVEPFGADWPHRFDNLLVRAESVTIVNGSMAVSDGSIELAAVVAKGMAIDRSQRLETTCRSMQITDRSDEGLDPSQIKVDVDRTMPRLSSNVIDPSKMIMLIAAANSQSLARYDLAEISMLHGIHIAASDDIGDAAKALARLAGSRSVGPAAATLVVAADVDSISDTDIARVVRIAQSTPEGSVGASMEAAMALKALHPEIRIEPIGELPDQGRALVMYALTGASHTAGAIAGSQRLV
jgi:hypothetical protein